MTSAMDRSPKSPASRAWIGLALVLCAADLGCARLKSSKRDTAPAELGRAREGNDVYADAHRSGQAATPPAAGATLATAGADAASNPVGLLQVPGDDADRSKPGPKLVSRSQDRGGPAPSQAPSLPPDPAQVVAEARSALDRMKTYQVFMHRQERVNGTLLPEEDVILAIRRQPVAVRLSWPSGPHNGREVLYRADEPGGLMHVNPGSPLPRMNLAPDSPLVMRNSRHPITEAGFDSLVQTLEADLGKPNEGGLTVADADVSSSGGVPPQILTRITPAAETWRVTIDAATHLPTVVECTNARGELLERYVFRDVQANPPELSDPAAFDPEARWGPPRGLFGLGRANKPNTPTPR